MSKNNLYKNFSDFDCKFYLHFNYELKKNH